MIIIRNENFPGLYNIDLSENRGGQKVRRIMPIGHQGTIGAKMRAKDWKDAKGCHLI